MNNPTRAHNYLDKMATQWPWWSFAVPVYAILMIIQSIVMFIVPEAWDTPTFAVLYDAIPIYLWATANFLIGIATLFLTTRDRNKWIGFLISGMLLLESFMIGLAMIDGYDVAPTAFFRSFAVALIIWLSLMNKPDNITRKELRDRLE